MNPSDKEMVIVDNITPIFRDSLLELAIDGDCC